jgi:hypothetical protein
MSNFGCWARAGIIVSKLNVAIVFMVNLLNSLTYLRLMTPTGSK